MARRDAGHGAGEHAADLVDPDAMVDETIAASGEAVRRRAYEYYLDRGGDDGRADEDWYRAEREIRGPLNAALQHAPAGVR